jgi:acyl-CoA thioesterase II
VVDVDGGSETWLGFASHLALGSAGQGSFTGRCLSGRGDRIFGGHVAAHAVMAAGRCSDSDRVVRSIHISFLAAGDCHQDVQYDVTLLRGGRTLEHWRVDATQGGTLLATSVVALDRVEAAALTHARQGGGMAGDPRAWTSLADEPPPGVSWIIRTPFDIRKGEVLVDAGDGSPRRDIWWRVLEDLDEDPLVHAAVVVFASDIEVTRTADVPHVERMGRRFGASLDHAVWFHRGFDVHDWWLHRVHSPSYQGQRAFVTGDILPRGGDVAVSIAQQGLVRMTPAADQA